MMPQAHFQFNKRIHKFKRYLYGGQESCENSAWFYLYISQTFKCSEVKKEQERWVTQ